MEQNKLHIFLVFSFCLLGTIRTLAQRPIPNNTNAPVDTVAFVDDSLKVEYDTTILDVFYFQNIDSLVPYTDSLLDYFHFISPQEQWGNPGHNLGNHGGSMLRSLVNLPDQLMMDLGYNQYMYLEKTHENTPHYSLNRPFSNLQFTPYGGNQDNFFVDAIFSRKFQENINFTIDFDRISIQDIYQSQAVKHSSIASHFRYDHPKGKYSSAFGYFGHFVTENHNGGVEDIDERFVTTLDIDVKLSNAQSRYQKTGYHFDQWYKMVNAKDLGLILHHHSYYETGFYKYTDETRNNIYSNFDTAFYSDQYLVDIRGLRVYNFERSLGHELSLKFPFAGYGSLSIQAGQETKNFDLDGEKSIRRNNLWGEVRATVSPFSSFNAYGVLMGGLADATGTFKFDTGASLDFKKYFTLFGGFKVINRQVDLNFQQVYISKQLVFDNDFDNEIWTETTLGLAIPITKTKLSLANISAASLVYVNDEQTIVQAEEGINVQQVKLFQDFSLWKFKTTNVIGLQFFNNNVWKRPSLISQHQLYFESGLFKRALYLQTGIYLRNTQQAQHMSYNGLYGSFYGTTNDRVWYPYSELFANVKVQNFKFFVKLENAYQVMQDLDVNDNLNLLSDDHYYQTFEYPQYDWAVRFGINWILKD